MNYKKVLLLGLFISIICSSSVLAETIVFEGMPLAQNYTSLEAWNMEGVGGKDRVTHKLVITKETIDDVDHYYWFSRGKKELKYSQSGIFHYFVDPKGSGYIKITKGDEESPYFYMEHMNIALEMLTFWGVADKFKP